MPDQLESGRPAPATGSGVATVAVWFDRHVDTIHRYVARRVGDEMARELTAETFRIALERFDTYVPDRGGERPWLYGIATNVLRRHGRSEQRRVRAQLRLAVTSPVVIGAETLDTEARLDAQQQLRHVARVIGRLDPADRDLLILVAVEGCTSTEAADALDIPAGTVRSRLHRIRTQLRDQGATR